MKKLLYLLPLLSLYTSCLKSDYSSKSDNAANVIVDNGQGTGDATWTSDKEYLIDGLVYVNSGQTLTIEPGTVIRAKLNSEGYRSALIVSRGGKIIAEGTKDAPIIFTSEDDDLSNSVDIMETGKWGGIIILGSAPLAGEQEQYVEGVEAIAERTIYGGSIVDDNSGILKYVSIRHAGSILADNNEINGLTLAGVGNGTTIDFVEVISSADDGFEVFGGTVNLTHLVSAYCDDDLFDFDLGYNGNCQFLVGIQKESSQTSFIAEHSGVESGKFTQPKIANATFIGEGYYTANSQKPLIEFNSGSAGIYYNSIFLNQELAVKVENSNNEFNSFNRWINGELVIENNILDQIAGNKPGYAFREYGEKASNDSLLNMFYYSDTTVNQYANIDIDFKSDQKELAPKSSFTDNLSELPEGLETVGYKGAIGDQNWLEGWTALWTNNLIK